MRFDWFTTAKIPNEVVEFLLMVKISLPEPHGVFQRDTRDDLSFDYEMLEEELQQTPAMMAFYNALAAEQKAKISVIQRKIANTKGAITERILKDFGDRGIKIRREDLKDIIESDDSMNNLHAKLILETLRLDKVRAVAESISAKNENLRSLAGFKREEKRSIK